MNVEMLNDEINIPSNVNEAIALLEKVLGASREKNTRHFHIYIDRQIEYRPEQDKPLMLIENRGELIIVNPFLSGGCAVFDFVEKINRKIYENKRNDKPVLVQKPQRFLVARFTIRPGNEPDEPWLFDMFMLSHSIPKYIGQPYLRGSVNWLENGFSLTGIATDSAYASGGKLLPVVGYATIKIRRTGNQLFVEDQWQLFQHGCDSDGNTLPVPDFRKPVGDACQWLAGIGDWEEQ